MQLRGPHPSLSFVSSPAQRPSLLQGRSAPIAFEGMAARPTLATMLKHTRLPASRSQCGRRLGEWRFYIHLQDFLLAAPFT
ncbi:uncharacterized protein BKA78DRAFT_101522 [Phyllosticta capitalensis]|uniref:uncharacterized protein n=1 Tax=Phyllosticta capitalensis TaxID=121624 RepID=UPI0031300E9B